jgi:hypothetical protein
MFPGGALLKAFPSGSDGSGQNQIRPIKATIASQWIEPEF